MIDYFYKSRQKPLTTLKKYQRGCWICVTNPDEDEMDKLSKKLDIDIGYLQDAMDPFEVPRLEIVGNNFYLYTRTPYNEGSNLSTTPVLFIISKTFIATISQKELVVFDRFLKNKINFSTVNRMNFFIQAIFEISEIYNSSLISINKKIYHASSNIEKIENKDITQFVTYENTTNEFLNRLLQTNNMLNSLLVNRKIDLDSDEKELLNDLFLSNSQLIEISKNSLQTVKNIRDSYSTILTNNLNRTIKLLTSLTIILNIPTMIAGLWGMNTVLPFQDFKYAFFLILAIILGLCFLLIYIFRKNDWL